ncbi:uncharacterized protein LOC124117932 [Haliotis rufescens]|uniref:uncharacterized protein LOC124117932 n=1 Tax=Haliotis rufescens TaxID=6454 RepID=UPI00201E7E00|nr:uncharacterized protein LOC124117932 [Haliotis rufescens]
MPISEKESNEFFKMNSELETKYGSKLQKASDGCLHLQFLHETEEEAKRMCDDKDFVKERFLQYMAGVGMDATSCTVEASYTHVAPSSKQAEHIPKKDPYATSESGDAKGIGGTTFDDDSSSENLDESFFSLDGSEDSDRQTHNVLDTKIPSTSAEEDSENEDTSTQIQSTHLPSYSERHDLAETGTKRFEGHASGRSITVTGVIGGTKRFEGHASGRSITVTGVIGGTAIHTPCRHCRKERRGQLRRNISMESLKELARSALRPNPLPAEVIQIYGCDTCDNVTEESRRECELGKHVFFIHLFDQSENEICTCELMQKTQYQMKKILSALRNTHGGILYVHSSTWIEDTRSFVDSILSTLTSPGEVVSEVFECEFDEACPNILRIEVERSATFITADLKTKQPTCMLKYQSVSLDTLKSRLFSQRTVQNTAPTLQGVSYIKHGKAVVKLYVQRWSYGYRSVDRSLSDKVSELIDKVHLSEHVSSLSKRKKGGNIFVGEERFYEGDMEGLNIVPPGKWRGDELKRTLEQELLSRIFVFENKYSDVNDVFTIGIHNTGDDTYIIEVAVRPVNGCVFHDALGPASFELEEREIAGLKYDACVRLSFDDWFKKTFPEMKIGNTEHK